MKKSVKKVSIKPMKKEVLLLSIEEGTLKECPQIANLWLDILTIEEGDISVNHLDYQEKRRVS